MEVERIVQMRLADPFKAFRLVMDDGTKLLVDKPYYLGISRNRRHIIWSTRDGGWQRVDPRRIVDAVFVARDRNGASKARARGKP
jgi:hypothetical protein